ncbi:hypothetical protein N7504_004064 [Penicillium tannophilum]|nr:hypothetical protein N7504_004064 [Penicillium tannophilum]
MPMGERIQTRYGEVIVKLAWLALGVNPNIKLPLIILEVSWRTVQKALVSKEPGAKTFQTMEGEDQKGETASREATSAMMYVRRARTDLSGLHSFDKKG